MESGTQPPVEAAQSDDTQLGPPTMGDHEDEARRAAAYTHTQVGPNHDQEEAASWEPSKDGEVEGTRRAIEQHLAQLQESLDGLGKEIRALDRLWAENRAEAKLREDVLAEVVRLDESYGCGEPEMYVNGSDDLNSAVDDLSNGSIQDASENIRAVQSAAEEISAAITYETEERIQQIRTSIDNLRALVEE